MEVRIIGTSLFDTYGGEAQPTSALLTVTYGLFNSNNVQQLTVKHAFTQEEMAGKTAAEQTAIIEEWGRQWGLEQTAGTALFGDITKLVGRKIALPAEGGTVTTKRG